MKFPSYTTRKDAFSPEELWTLYPDHLAISTRLGPDAETLEKIRFPQIKRAELQWEKRLYRCILTLEDGRVLEFQNRTWSEAKAPVWLNNEYVLFVPNVLKALGRESLECRFTSGIEPFTYFKKLFYMSACVGFWVGLIGFFGMAGVLWLSIAMLFLIPFSAPKALRWLKTHRPDEFSPSHIPVRLLPKFVR